MTDETNDPPIYSDLGYFTRGRPGYRADPVPPLDVPAVLVTIGLSVLGLGVIGVWIFLLMRTIS